MEKKSQTAPTSSRSRLRRQTDAERTISDASKRLLNVRKRLLEIPQKFQGGGIVLSVSVGPAPTPDQRWAMVRNVAKNLQLAADGLRTGQDRLGNPISVAHIANGMKRMANDVLGGGGSVLLPVTPKGHRVFDDCITEIEQVVGDLSAVVIEKPRQMAVPHRVLDESTKKPRKVPKQMNPDEPPSGVRYSKRAIIVLLALILVLVSTIVRLCQLEAVAEATRANSPWEYPTWLARVEWIGATAIVGEVFLMGVTLFFGGSVLRRALGALLAILAILSLLGGMVALCGAHEMTFEKYPGQRVGSALLIGLTLVGFGCFLLWVGKVLIVGNAEGHERFSKP